MAEVGFCTAITFGERAGSATEKLIETIDNYFYLGGKRAYVFNGSPEEKSAEVMLDEDSSSCLFIALKVAIISTLLLPVTVLLLAAKAYLRCQYTFHHFEETNLDLPSHIETTVPVSRSFAQQKLEEGIEISRETIEKIEQLVPKILGRQDDGEIIWYGGRNLVFSLRSLPQYVFKTASPSGSVLRQGRWLGGNDLVKFRFANMIKAEEVCLAHQLGLLVIPHAKLFTAGSLTLIAEEHLPLVDNESAQEEFYKLPNLTEAIRQLATFILKTGFSDVEWRNAPVLDTTADYQGQRRIALVDTEEFDGPQTGIFGGGFGRRGLINCLHSEEQINLILEKAARHGLRDLDAKRRRMEQIRSDEELNRFYRERGILENPRKPIKIENLEELGLNLNESDIYSKRIVVEKDGEKDLGWKEKTVTLGKVVRDVISEINKKITEAKESASPKGKRHLLLNTNQGKMHDYYHLGNEGRSFLTEAELEKNWLRKIIKALVNKGYLFKLETENGHGFFVQA